MTGHDALHAPEGGAAPAVEQALPALSALAVHARRLALAADRPAQWAAISALLEQAFGHRLFTALSYLHERQIMRRLYTSDGAISPLGGYKSTGNGPWSRHVLEQGRIYVAHDAGDVRTVFSEAQMLIDRGLCSAFNLPVRYEGRVVGSLNLLSHAQAYRHADHALGEIIAGLCAPIFVEELRITQREAAAIPRADLDQV